MPSWLMSTVYRDQGSGIRVKQLSLIPALLLRILPEEPCGHGEANEDYGAAKDGLRDAAGHAGRGVAADCAGDHGEKAVAPDDLSVEDEEDEGDAVGHGGGDHFKPVDFVQILKAEEGENGDDDETCAGAEVADVDADGDGA